jgi:integrase
MVDHFQKREEHWAIVNLVGKGGQIRTISVPDWVCRLLNDWIVATGIQAGKLFRKVSSAGKPWGNGVTEKLVWHVVKDFAARIGDDRLAPNDLRRTCVRLCRAAGGELEQLQFLLRHVSGQTTERYLGCTQRRAPR